MSNERKETPKLLKNIDSLSELMSGKQASIVTAETSPPVDPTVDATESMHARIDANVLANVLKGQRKSFSSYLDIGLVEKLEEVRDELKRRTNMTAYQASKSLILEAAITLIIADFEENLDDSFLVEYAKSMK